MADYTVGIALNRLLDRVPPDKNETGAAHYVIHKVNDPILIVGSSRAQNHYYPDIVADSLSRDTYNAGRPGYFISYQCCLINMVLDRYTPDIIIWELSLEALYARAQDPVNILKPYYRDYRVVQEALDEKEGRTARIKCLSSAYRYNGLVIDMLYRWLSGGNDNNCLKGMEPIPHTGMEFTPELAVKKSVGGPIDSSRVKRLHETLQRLHDAKVKVFIFDSPEYCIRDVNRDKSSESLIYEECKQFSIPVLDNRNLGFFLDHPELFRDDGHLFDDGARIYSQFAAHQIVQLIHEESVTFAE